VPAGPAAGLQLGLHRTGVEAKPLKNSGSSAVPPDQTEKDVLRSYRIVPQADRLPAGIFQRTLCLSAEGVRIDSGGGKSGWWLTQNGLASSISMMGMPSSTG
jgi:hypothetical protein